MQRFLLVCMCKISLFFVILPLNAADQSTLQVSQVRDVVKNIEIATQIGQSGQDQVNSLQDLEKVFGSTMSALTVDMNNLATQELQSIAFGGYTFIANPYNRSAGVSLNILKELLPLDFKQMAQNNTNTICLGLFGADSSGNLLTSLSANNTTGVLDHFKLYIFKNDGTLLGTGPQYIPLNKYYSQTQQKFITPVFGSNIVSQTAGSNSGQNFEFLVNGQDITTHAQMSYPYLICIENILGIDAPNRYFNFPELSSLLPNIATSTPVASFYQTLDSLEIIIGNSAFSFNQNSLNQSTDIAANGICADISKYIAPLANTGMKLIFAAVDANGNIISSIVQAKNLVDHYLLYIFDPNSNLIKAIYVNPAYTTDASYFKINQPVNGITVRINGQTITQAQQYSYPVLINLTYGSGITMPALSSLTNKITLKKSETLSSLVYNLNASSGAATLDLSKKSLFGANWLDAINELLAVGETILVNVQQTLYSTGASQASSGYELIFTVYALDSTTSVSSQVAQQSFASDQLSGLNIGYKTNLSQVAQTLMIPNSGTNQQNNLQNNWIAIIPSATAVPTSLTYSALQKISTYGTLKAILSMNKNTLYYVPVTSYVATENTIPGWYNAGSKQYSGSGFSLQLEQMQKTGKGYFFVEDKLGNVNPFNGISGVAALDSKSNALSSLEATIVPGSSCTMVLLGFDQQGNYIPDIIKTVPFKFGLFIFDAKGNNVSGSPVSFSAKDYVGLGNYTLQPNSTGPANFVLSGLGSHQDKNLTYPFALKVTWKLKGKPSPKPAPTPKPMPIPISAQIPSSMVISIYKQLRLQQFGCLLSSQTSKSFDQVFMNTIVEKLKVSGDSVKIKISTSNNAITATAYVKTQQISSSKPLSLPNGQTIKSLLYTISGGSEMSLPITLMQGYKDIWLEFRVVDVLPYSFLSSLALSVLQKYISLNSTSIQSSLLTPGTFPGWGAGQGWNLNLVQMQGSNGYAFLEDPWNNYITTLFNVTTNQGVATTNINLTSIQSTIRCQSAGAQMCGQCNMVLLAFDEKNNYMSDILDQTNAPKRFGLFMYDATGNILSGFPVQFSAKNYVGLGNYALKSTTPPAQFILGGLGQSQNPTLTYPFLLTVRWQYVPSGAGEYIPPTHPLNPHAGHAGMQ